VNENAWTGGEEQAYFYSSGCWVFPWGIGWRLGWNDRDWKHHTGQWEDITKITRSSKPEWIVAASFTTTIMWTSSTVYYLLVRLADGRSAQFSEEYGAIRMPVGWPMPKVVPGVTQQINIRKLERLIKMGVARNQLS
jgi:hypothetical protein